MLENNNWEITLLVRFEKLCLKKKFQTSKKNSFYIFDKESYI